MKLLFDESLPFSLRDSFLKLTENYSITFVQEKNWGGKLNGELLSLTEKDYDVFVTCDQSLPHQQNLDDYEITIAVLKALSNRQKDLKVLLPELVEKLQNISSGEKLIEVSSPT